MEALPAGAQPGPAWTRALFAAWAERPVPVLAPWAAGSLAIGCGLLLTALAVALIAGPSESYIPVFADSSAGAADVGRILEKLLDKDRALRYQTATDLKTDLMRLKRMIDSGGRPAAGSGETRAASGAHVVDRSVAVLFFENLSGVKEDEYFRDGITEDIITELSKIKGIKSFSRATVLGYRDKPVKPQQIELAVDHALEFVRLRRENETLRQELMKSRNERQAPARNAAFMGGAVGSIGVGGASAPAVPPEAVVLTSLNIDEAERALIMRALEVTKGNRTRTAELLGISVRTLRNKLNGPGRIEVA